MASFQDVNPVAMGREPEIEEAANAARQTGGVTFESWDSQKMIIWAAKSDTPMEFKAGTLKQSGAADVEGHWV